MKIVDFRSLMRFSPEKMQRTGVLKTGRVEIDLHCFEAGQAQRSHRSSDADRIYFVLEGTGRFSIGRTTRELKTGQAVLAPLGDDHGVVNVTEERLTLLVITAPPEGK